MDLSKVKKIEVTTYVIEVNELLDAGWQLLQVTNRGGIFTYLLGKLN